MLVFAIRGAAVALDAANYIDGGLVPEGGMGAVWEYVQEHGASVSLLHPERARIINVSERWQLGVPASESRDDVTLSEIYLVHLPAGDDGVPLERALSNDRERIAYVHRPAVRHPLHNPNPCPGGGGFTRDWGVNTCHFPAVWTSLDMGTEASVIAVIDQGRDEGHHELKGRITEMPPQGNNGMKSRHAGAVAGIISAIRSSTGDERLKGCCSANLHLYNVWNTNGKFNPEAYYHALGAIKNPPVSVVNLSIGGPKRDDTEAREVAACLDRNVVLVAAMGNLGNDGIPAFPARYCRVVAVGGTTPSNVRVASSTRGSHMWISAPGERIWTIEGSEDYDCRTGTSYATPFVSAAAWLARKRKPCLSVDEIRELLARSVEPCTVPIGIHSAEIGHGRLDMAQLMTELGAMRNCP